MVENVSHLPSGLPCPKEKTDECLVNIFGKDMKTVSYTFLFTALSIASQALVFISLGAMADYGRWRKKLFMFSTWLGSFFATAVLFVQDSRKCFECLLGVIITLKIEYFWVMSIIQAICNMLYGTALVFYNSFLPILVDHHPKLVNYLSKPDTHPESEEAIKLSEEVSNFISTRGLGLGYAGGVTFLLIVLAVLNFVNGEPTMMRIFIALSGVWWFVFSLFSMKYLKARPGPELPKGENYILFSWKKSKSICELCRKWQAQAKCSFTSNTVFPPLSPLTAQLYIPSLLSHIH
jgi:UMF1 family MFS transporter